MPIDVFGQFGRWVDRFQQQLSLPVAKHIANAAGVPLINVKKMLEAGSENPLLMVVLGPFAFEHDNSYSWWHAYKVVWRSKEIATALCRLDREGTGGFFSVKLWDIYKKEYLYCGDPAQIQPVKPQWVYRLTEDHLASQYKVGFVEDKTYAIPTQQLQTSPYSQITEEQVRQWQESKKT